MNLVSEQEKELVVARLEVLSPTIHFSVGAETSNVSRDEMVEHVKANDAIGNDYVKTELHFLRSLKDGVLMDLLTS